MLKIRLYFFLGGGGGGGSGIVECIRCGATCMCITYLNNIINAMLSSPESKCTFHEIILYM